MVRLCVAVGFPLLIGISRIYLGVHYPSDVLLGLTLGFLTSVGIILFWKLVAKIVSNWRASLQLLLVAVVVFLLNHFSCPVIGDASPVFRLVKQLSYLLKTHIAQSSPHKNLFIRIGQVMQDLFYALRILG